MEVDKGNHEEKEKEYAVTDEIFLICNNIRDIKLLSYDQTSCWSFGCDCHDFLWLLIYNEIDVRRLCCKVSLNINEMFICTACKGL